MTLKPVVTLWMCANLTSKQKGYFGAIAGGDSKGAKKRSYVRKNFKSMSQWAKKSK
jgi:hypothetical protein